MSQGLRELTDPEWNAALEAVLLPASPACWKPVSPDIA